MKNLHVDISATTGKVLDFEQEIKDEDTPQGVSPTISLENA